MTEQQYIVTCKGIPVTEYGIWTTYPSDFIDAHKYTKDHVHDILIECELHLECTLQDMNVYIVPENESSDSIYAKESLLKFLS